MSSAAGVETGQRRKDTITAFTIDVEDSIVFFASLKGIQRSEEVNETSAARRNLRHWPRLAAAGPLPATIISTTCYTARIVANKHKPESTIKSDTCSETKFWQAKF
jgi:hypothetical protein